MLVYDEQGKFLLPWNLISSEIKHDMRLFISMIQPEPYVYKISKVKNTSPKGIITFTVEQVEFNQFTDYVNLNTGEMLTDYYKSAIKPDDGNNQNNSLTFKTSSYNIGIGSRKHIIANIIDENNNAIDCNNSNKFEWNILLGNQDITNDKKIITSFEQNDNDLLFTFVDDDVYVDSIITVICKYGNISKSMEFSVTY